jgi:hypothetical protein
VESRKGSLKAALFVVSSVLTPDGFFGRWTRYWSLNVTTNRYGHAMTTEPRAALDRLIAALEAHLSAASRRAGEADPAVVSAYQVLADAFESYDEALYDAFDEVTPFVLYDDAEDALADDEVDDDDDDDDLEDLEDDDEETAADAEAESSSRR